ncbi:MAG: cell division protein FtsZ [Candidatus Aenigmatarchaeota archaeon]
MSEFETHKANIVVMGAGGGGCNTISRLTELNILGATTVGVNTDAKHLDITRSHKRLLIGKELTRGLGAGGYPNVGAKAALESKREIEEILGQCDLLFLTCGLGGGTGTGALPEIAKMAKEKNAIVISAVTFPFHMEKARMSKAEDGLMHLRENSDTVILIENQKLLQLAGNKPLKEAFGVADNIIATMIKGITETISQPSLVNLDYADVRTIMHSGGVATIGVGESNTKDRANEAVNQALSNPLLDVDYEGATGALIQIIGGEDLTLDEINHIGEKVSNFMSPDAMVMWGARILPEYHGKIQVITIITGVSSPYITGSSQVDHLNKKTAQSLNDLGIKMVS